MGLGVSIAVNNSVSRALEKLAENTKAAQGNSIRRAAVELQSELRRQASGAGLGRGVANAWRVDFYPQPSRIRAALVWTKAPKIIRAFDADTVIVPKAGRYLAIPTENVPARRGFRGAGRRKMGPREVEAHFGQKLALVPSLAQPGTLLLVMEGVRARSGRGVRRATRGRMRQGRAVRRFVMFVLVRQARLARRLDVRGAAARAGARLQTHLAGAFETLVRS